MKPGGSRSGSGWTRTPASPSPPASSQTWTRRRWQVRVHSPGLHWAPPQRAGTLPCGTCVGKGVASCSRASLRWACAAAPHPCPYPPTAPHPAPSQPAAKLTRRGHEVQPSLDAGRFVCNLTYYLSLLHSQLGRERDGRPLHSLFLHVPPAEVVPLHRQLHLLLDLMHEVAAQLAAQSAATPAAAEAAAAEEQAQATAAVDGGASPSLAAAADEAALPNGATSNTMLVRETAAVQAVAVTEAATRSSGASAAGQPRAPQVAARPD
jgi:hypothetical protein